MSRELLVMVEWNQSQIKGCIEKQRGFFQTGQTLDVGFRVRQLKKLQQVIRTYEEEILTALKADLGKALLEAYATEIGYVYKSLCYALKHIHQWARPQKVSTPIFSQIARSEIRYEPYGRVLIIGPYNYPFQLVMEPLIGAIAAGNCAIVKPSEMATETERIIVKLLNEIFDPAYICAVHGAVEVNIALLEQPFDYIFFTGSTQVGKKVAAAAAKHLTPYTLELGGKSPVFVDETANFNLAAKRIVWGKFLNAGQTCVAPDYVYVDARVEEVFMDLLKQAIQNLFGQNVKESPDLGRIINTQHFDRLEKLLHVQKGEVFWGGQIDREEKYIAPTILRISSWDEAVMKEEIFGPILPVLTYQNLEEALEVVRQQSKPLALYIFSKREAVVQQVMDSVSSGGVCVNDTISHLINPNLPFGGVGLSGIGAYHGRYSFATFSHSRSVMRKSNLVQIDIAYPPYTEKKYRWIRRLFS